MFPALAEYMEMLSMIADLAVHGETPREQQDRTSECLREASLIAVVDDDESIRESMQALLRSAGYQVQTFASADSFLVARSRDETECLILDVRMPGMDGFGLQGRLNSEHSDIPIIFITAHDDGPSRQRAMAAGALDVLHKPFAASALLASVEIAIARWRTSD